MFRIKLKIINHDYATIADRFLPDLLQEKTAEHKMSNRIANMLLVKDGSASKFAKGVIKIIPQRAKNNIAYDFITNNKDKIVDSVNKYLEDRQIAISVADMIIKDPDKAGNDMLKFEIVLNEIDYNSVIENTLPKLLISMSEKSDKQGELAKVLLDMEEIPIKMIVAALNILPQQAKNNLIVKLQSIYNNDIIKFINDMVSKENMIAEVTAINIENQSNSN
ncbi:MAG: hypothetical protein ACYDEX_23145 [Mobilitalea sp.]